VTREAALTSLVTFSPIERAEAFALAMTSAQRPVREEASKEAIARAMEAGYDVSQNAETLMGLYESALRA
jgi:hypothetical protein